MEKSSARGRLNPQYSAVQFRDEVISGSLSTALKGHSFWWGLWTPHPPNFVDLSVMLVSNHSVIALGMLPSSQIDIDML